jgi:hypothetical protein
MENPMNLISKTVIAAAAVLCASSASAAVITFGGTATPNDGLTTSRAGATVVTFNNGAKPAGYSGDGSVLQGSQSGYYAAPAGDSSKYLSVAYPKVAGTETASLGGNYNYFGLYWGSMDDYNTLSFYSGNLLLESITGANVIAAGTALGDQTAPGSNRYVNLDFGTSFFDRVVFSTGNYAFESDNHAYGVSVPEPGTLALMGLGMLGAAFSARRRKLKAS